jgi:hypothetical protein
MTWRANNRVSMMYHKTTMEFDALGVFSTHTASWLKLIVCKVCMFVILWWDYFLLPVLPMEFGILLSSLLKRRAFDANFMHATFICAEL